MASLIEAIAILKDFLEGHAIPYMVIGGVANEDLVIYKAISERARDWSDIEGILLRQGARLDQDYSQNHCGRPLFDPPAGLRGRP